MTKKEQKALARLLARVEGNLSANGAAEIENDETEE